MGDFNEKFGNDIKDNVIGSFGLRMCNERRDCFIQHCMENEIIIMNTFFKQRLRKLYT